jgi:hypothetical protein
LRRRCSRNNAGQTDSVHAGRDLSAARQALREVLGSVTVHAANGSVLACPAMDRRRLRRASGSDGLRLGAAATEESSIGTYETRAMVVCPG